MKIIITADIHNGIPKKIDDCIWSMEVIRKYADDHSIDTVIVLGDLFHDRVNLNIEVLNKVYSFFDKTDKEFNQNWICFPGNHDMFLKNSWNINSITPLNRIMTIINEVSLLKIDGLRFWVVPFIHYESVYMKIIKEINKKCEPGDILLTHIGVNNAVLNECFLFKNWNIVEFEDTKFNRVYTGHFHCHQQVGDKVWYPGSPIPFRYDEGQVEHGFLVYDTEDNNHEFVPTYNQSQSYAPPDYVTILDEDAKEFDLAEGNNIRIVLDKEYTKDEILGMRQDLLDKGAISVSISKPKERIKEINNTSKSDSIVGLFSSWIEFDKPKDMNSNLLSKLNDQITEEAKERITVLDVDD